ncbi:AraC family transcriptional regulator [Megamonas hypermegale]|uniref:AraC family transcriptional regulator n=2 Tax=Megamonas hypermegale TaxID=158847 RepID=UPI000B3715BF|nr:AraC family transcriptional regulator [Megamonas hypermegale]OUO41771.1 AraC family transcriptional regulator [Megamonas hypermegale]
MEVKKISYEQITASEITKVRFCTFFDKGSYAPYHWHRAIELIYLLEGEMLVSFENTSHLLYPGECILINANMIHSNKATKSNKYILLQIPLDFIERFIPNINQIKFVVNDGQENDVKQSKIEMIKDFLKKMKELDDKQEENFLLYFNCLLFELLCLIQRNFSEKTYQINMSQKRRDFVRLNKILDYIAQNYTRTIPLDEIAQVAGFQEKYFCRFFKNHMGITFLEYQNEVRLSYIYSDLLNTDELISHILEKHGFNNYKLFMRMFKMRFGNTPLKIRKEQKMK